MSSSDIANGDILWRLVVFGFEIYFKLFRPTLDASWISDDYFVNNAKENFFGIRRRPGRQKEVCKG